MIYLPGPDDYVAALGSAIGRPARLFFRPKCDVTVSNWSDEREGQNEQVPPYSMCIRTAFVVCIRRGEITGAASRGKQPDARRRRYSEDGTHPCRCFRNKPADLLFLRSPDCSASDINIRVTKRPEHGTVETAAATDFPNFGKENIRYRCNRHKVRGQQVNYKSAEKYIGSDTFELLVLFPGGFAREVRLDIDVR